MRTIHPKIKCSILFYILILFSPENIHAQTIEGNHSIEIPEPLMFDLVRGLGAKKGELEINTLADFPINNASERGVDWAPEIEFAIFDGFAVELEFPLNDLELEAYKVAVQWTLGKSQNDKFIHGIQIISESFREISLQEFNFLYVPAYRINEVWSTIGLFGIMLETGNEAANKNYTIILNASIFADLSERTVIGLELNNSDPTFQEIDNNEMELFVIPQIHQEFNNGFSFQLGFGPKFTKNKPDYSMALRGIKTF